MPQTNLGTHILQNDSLTVELSREAYSGQRFDNTGIITQVTLKNKDGRTADFCTVESLIPGEGSGGIGLANEFDLDEPCSYPDTEEGDRFLKIGVGWLKKPLEEKYDFFGTYEIVDRGDFSETVKPDERSMTWKSGEYNGYGCIYSKKIKLAGNEIHISYELKNTGSKRLYTREYAHNFIAADCRINGGEGYVVSVSDEIINSRYQNKFVSKEKFPSYMALTEDECTNLKSWSLQRRTDGAMITETVGFQPCRMAVWAMPHVISCEYFMEHTLAVGKCHTWSRTYRFELV